MIHTSLVSTNLPHARDVLRYNADNLLSRGQEIAFVKDPDPHNVVQAVLRPGEFTLFNVRLAHSSPPNTSKDRRIGLAVRCVICCRLLSCTIDCDFIWWMLASQFHASSIIYKAESNIMCWP